MRSAATEEEVIRDLLAHLVAATSLLREAHEQGKQPKTVAASDRMFEQMLRDYDASVARGREYLLGKVRK